MDRSQAIVAVYALIGIFFILGMIYCQKMFGFNKRLKALDLPLYEKYRIRLFALKQPYAAFIFKKQYRSVSDPNVTELCHSLYRWGWAMQWSFYLAMVSAGLFYVSYS